jgi:hypothetical protein
MAVTVTTTAVLVVLAGGNVTVLTANLLWRCLALPARRRLALRPLTQFLFLSCCVCTHAAHARRQKQHTHLCLRPLHA